MVNLKYLKSFSGAKTSEKKQRYSLDPFQAVMYVCLELG